MRSANRCEPQTEQNRRNFPGEDFEAREEFLARNPTEFFARHRGDAGKRGAMRAPACLAMAVNDGPEFRIGFVANATAQAMTCKHAILHEHERIVAGKYNPELARC